MKRTGMLLLTVALIGFAGSSFGDAFSREYYWPEISTYEEMPNYMMGPEIGMLKNDLEFFKRQHDAKSHGLAVEAYNRLQLIFKIYAKRSGRSIEEIREMYGNPTM